MDRSSLVAMLEISFLVAMLEISSLVAMLEISSLVAILERSSLVAMLERSSLVAILSVMAPILPIIISDIDCNNSLSVILFTSSYFPPNLL